MLLELTVQDVGIIDRCELSLGRGFTVLTGETGAGKSLLVDAIGLALGGRADSELVRSGAKKAVVTLSVIASSTVLAVCAENGIELEDDGVLVIHREVSAEGRSTVRVNGRLASVGTLRRIGRELVDLHGQHDHQSLIDVERQIDFLDEWIGVDGWSLRKECASLHSDREQTRRRLEALRSSRRDTEQRIDMLKFQIEEIESVGPVQGEFEELAARLSRLQHSEKLSQSVGEAVLKLFDDDSPALERLGQAVRVLEESAKLDPELESTLDPLRQALYSLEDGERALRDYNGKLEMDPAALEEAAARMDSLKRLRKKYGEDETVVVSYLDNAKQELLSLTGGESSEDELTELMEKQSQQLRSSADKLTKLRKKRAEDLGGLITKNLHDLAMEKAQFQIRIEPCEPGPKGADDVEFFFSANPGEPARPLAKVASGGEISRVMLSVKEATAESAGVPTLIFDEIDTGLSGRAAAATANKMRGLSEHVQVLAISHLPQIAGQADTHFRIEKSEVAGRSVTQILMLEGDERIEEIARMLAGEKIGESALANARELVQTN